MKQQVDGTLTLQEKAKKFEQKVRKNKERTEMRDKLIQE